MALALRRVAPTLVASAATVIVAMLALLLADMGNTRSLGPTAAVGIAGTLLAMTTLMPAVIAVAGPWVFWPRVPRPDPHGAQEPPPRLWAFTAAQIRRQPATLALGCVVVLAACVTMLTATHRLPTTPLTQYRTAPESLTGARTLTQAFPPGAIAPLLVVVQPAGTATDTAQDAAAVHRLTSSAPAVAGVDQVRPGDDAAWFPAVLSVPPYSPEGRDAIRDLRDRLHSGAPPGARVYVGGSAAQQVDVIDHIGRDTLLIIPIALAGIFVVLALLLRALVAPLLVLAATVVSFAAAYSLAAFVCTRLIGLGGIDPSVLLYSAVFLIALGVDYTVFLTARAREQCAALGAREAMLAALITTGGVISSAGLVLAATFAVLATVNFTVLIEVGITVAIGVLLDTFIVRTVLVPALAWRLGERFWWPNATRFSNGSHGQTKRGHQPAEPPARVPVRLAHPREPEM